MTLLAGTGHTAFLTLPVIAEVAKREGVRPSRPLAIATVASQIAITASPISAAVVFSALTGRSRVDYVQLLLIAIPSSFIAVMLGAAITNFIGKELKDDPVYLERLAKGLIKNRMGMSLAPHASVRWLIFCVGIVGVVPIRHRPTVGRSTRSWPVIMPFDLCPASLVTLLGGERQHLNAAPVNRG